MIGCALACRAPAQSSAPCPEPGAAVDAKFSPGQVWTYYSRETEPAATITVLKVETLPKIGVIVHIRLDGIRLHNCSSGPEPREIEHAPFTREALDRSVVKLIRTGEVPSFQEGYSRWRHDCGGVYTITVAEMVAADERTLNAGMGCHS
ncbi:MAG TPA: hypothetical protein VN734_05705 [Acidobacteriaceae bacterium]|nr:hypothetical protein [Acidobacteriaceae bacterium]